MEGIKNFASRGLTFKNSLPFFVGGTITNPLIGLTYFRLLFFKKHKMKGDIVHEKYSVQGDILYLIEQELLEL